MKKQQKPPLFLLLLVVSVFLLCQQPILATDFVFNGFNSSSLLLYGYAVIESRILSLTNETHFIAGRALYPSKIRTKDPNSSFVLPFSISFIFAMAPYKNDLSGHGLVFIFVPHTGIEGTTTAQYIGLFDRANNGNSSNHVFGTILPNSSN